MSLTVQQLLSDAKRLSSRLRDHDQSADHLISRAQEVLKEVDAMRQYQEDVENLNEVAHNRPRAQLVLGIQQENRHIRTLQQENKELRAALEEHQNALELIMSKYRQHVTRLVNAPHPDFNNINNYKIQMLAEKTEKVCEMASVMKEAVRVDEEVCNEQQELMARLVTENKGLRELLNISQRSLSTTPRVRKVAPTIHKEVQTDVDVVTKPEEEGVQTVTLPRPGGQAARTAGAKVASVDPLSPVSPEVISSTSPLPNVLEESGRISAELSSGDSDETGSEDESVKFDTIQRAGRRRTVIPREEKEKEKEENNITTSDVRVEVMQEGEVLSAGQIRQENEATMDSVVAGLVRQLVSDTVETSSPASIVSREVAKEPAEELKVVGNTTKELKVVGNTAENTISEKPIAESDKLIAKSDKPIIESDIHLEVEPDKPKTESKDSAVEKSDQKTDLSYKPTTSDSAAVDKSDSDLSTTELAQTKAPADTSKPTQSHSRSNSKGKKANTNKNSPKKKKNNS